MPLDETQLDAAFAKATGPLAERLKDTADQVKSLRADHAKTDGRLDEIVKAFDDAKSAGGDFQAIAQKMGDHTDRIGDLNDQLDKLEATIARGGQSGQKTESLGQAFVKSDQFGAVQQTGRGTVSLAKAVTGLASPTPPDTAAIVYDERETPYRKDPDPILSVWSYVPVGGISSSSLTYRRAFHDYAAAGRVEKEAIAAGAVSFSLETATVVNIGAMIETTEEVLADESALASELDYHLTEGLRRERSRQIIHGVAGPTEIPGLMGAAPAFSPTVTAAGDAKYRQVRDAILQLRKARRRPSMLALTPEAWAEIELTADADGMPIIARPSDGAPARLWGVPVIDDDELAAGEWLLGDFRLGSMLKRRQGVVIQASTEHNDNFQTNMVSIRATERYAHAIYFPDCYVKGPFQ